MGGVPFKYQIMTIGGVPPLINKPWFINPGLTLIRSKFQRFALNDQEEEQVTAVNRQTHLRQHVAETQD